jgi:hypothetical protein
VVCVNRPYVNSENARSITEASSVGKHEYGGKEDESSTGNVWDADFTILRPVLA